MNLKNILSAGLLIVACATASITLHSCHITPQAEVPALLPIPGHMEQSNQTFTLTENASVSHDEGLETAVGYLRSALSATGYTLQATPADGDIQLTLVSEGKPGSYTLDITPRRVLIKGNGYGGVVSGISTLRQLLAKEIESQSVIQGSVWRLPCVSITDEPRFGWRGIMLDVSRHFFTKTEVKELLDVMALYKLNKFHWHLTDDQGWRIEIKKYPLLTQKGAWRKWNNQDRECMRLAGKEDNTDFHIPADRLRVEGTDTLYGGFYTQEDIKEIVSYASERGIDVIPEIDMPGHFLEAISHYPGLSCFERIGWGEVFSSPICPGKERALEFCQDIYKEVFGLFPYRYVHIGGDEVEKNNWKRCPDCQRRMRENGLKNEEELQSWFIGRMEKFFNENGRQMIGWDEILEGGVSATATVMWWRSWQADVIERTTAHGNSIICCPNACFYLDYQQDKNSVRNIYSYQPVPQGLALQQQESVMGIQGNLWTEYVPSKERMQYMMFPRLLAIAELAWSQPGQLDWQDFNSRMLSHLPRLGMRGINYRIPDIEGFYDSNLFLEEGQVNLTCSDTSAVIRYTTDGTIPTAASPRYEGTLTVKETTDFTFRTFRSNGKGTDMVKTRFIRRDYTQPAEPASVQPGLKAVWHEYRGSSCAEIQSAAINGTYQTADICIPEGVKGNIGLVITGFIRIPKDDIYTFHLMSDDGSVLTIDGLQIIDNDGDHAPREKTGQHAMKAGLHPIEVRYFDHNGGQLAMKVFNSDNQEMTSVEYLH